MEIQLNKKEVFFGLFNGFLANLLGVIITIFVLFQETNSSNIFKVINDSFLDNSITKLISLGAILNLIVFFIFLKYDYEERARGVLLATFIIAILTIYINNF